ncbi:hypothetical protein JNB63_06060 [Microbacterium trichothecenolyticum]|uniref:Uncharacterized protein n=1 Tax=Microbacterium ureisolvens TaxID=2781186 RepID=A0ABS7I1C1_9MICO|nr:MULTISPECIES: hypothetical protein [Microbacterium]MBW9110582.1 hypothetical protein [Microbacterium ureisolvens]MBW9119651.1 hypothetical protein [Microbacterium trichothecenolyticum]
MYDTTYAGQIIHRQRVDELERELEIRRSQAERGYVPARLAGRPLSAWFRGILHYGGRAAAIAGH